MAIAEATRACDSAEARKRALDAEELALYQAHAEDCTRCLQARQEKARREAATAAAALQARAAELATEDARISADEMCARLPISCVNAAPLTAQCSVCWHAAAHQTAPPHPPSQGIHGQGA